MAKWRWPIMQEHHSEEIRENPADIPKSAINVEDLAESKAVLRIASEIISGRRKDDYGSPERSFDTIAKLWNVYLNSCRGDRAYVTATDVAMMMVLLKVARTDNVPTGDSLVDICGYAALAAECIDY